MDQPFTEALKLHTDNRTPELAEGSKVLGTLSYGRNEYVVSAKRGQWLSCGTAYGTRFSEDGIYRTWLAEGEGGYYIAYELLKPAKEQPEISPAQPFKFLVELHDETVLKLAKQAHLKGVTLSQQIRSVLEPVTPVFQSKYQRGDETMEQCVGRMVPYAGPDVKWESCAALPGSESIVFLNGARVMDANPDDRFGYVERQLRIGDCAQLGSKRGIIEREGVYIITHRKGSLLLMRT